MNYLIQRGKVRGQVINVPDGLPEILSDITREVLRCQPTTECLCQFIIDYLHSIIVAREKARAAKYIIDNALKQVDDIITDLCICHIDRESCENMAAVIEESFRHFLEKYRCEKNKEKEIIKYKEVDILEELIKRCKFSEEEMMVSRPLIEEAYERFVQAYMSAAETTGGTEALYQYFKDREIVRATELRLSAAAVKIQKAEEGGQFEKNVHVHPPSVPSAAKIQAGVEQMAVTDECSIKSVVAIHPEDKQMQHAENVAEQILTISPTEERANVLGAENVAEPKISPTTDTKETPAETQQTAPQEPTPGQPEQTAGEPKQTSEPSPEVTVESPSEPIPDSATATETAPEAAAPPDENEPAAEASAE